MSDNWVVQNLENALETWNEKLAEIWTLITQSPEQFKGGTIWNVVKDIHGAVQAIGLGLLVLFFVVGVMKTCAGTLGRKPARTEEPVIDVTPVKEKTDAAQDIIDTNVEPVDRMTEAMELAAQFVEGTEVPKFCVFDCKKRPTDNNCAHCPFFRNRPVPDGHFSAVTYPKGVISLRARNDLHWDTEIITEERRARADKLDTYEDTLIAKFCVEGCTKRARADTCEKCKYCTCAAGAEKEFAAQIRKARLLVK